MSTVPSPTPCRWIAALVLASTAMTALPGEDQPTLVDLHPENLILYPGEVRAVDIPFTIPAGHQFVPLRVVRSCTCVRVATLPPDAIPAGGQGVLHATFAAGDLPGEIESEFAVIGEDDGRPARLHCSLVGQIRDFLVWPHGTTIDLGERQLVDPPITTTVEVRRGPHPQRFDALAVRVDGGGGAVTATVAPHGDDRWTISLTRAPNHISGTVTARLLVDYQADGVTWDHGAERLLRWTTRGPWETLPAGAVFGVVPVDGKVRKVLLLRNRDGTTRAAVDSIVSSDPDRATGRLQDGGGAQHLECSFVGTSPIEAASGHFDVRFTDGIVLRIPYYASVCSPAGLRDAAPPADAPPATPPGF